SAVDSLARVAARDVCAHFGCQETAGAVAVFQCLTEDGFAGLVSLSRIDQSDASVDGGTHERNGSLLVDVAHAATNRPSPQAKNWYIWPVLAKLAIFHTEISY